VWKAKYALIWKENDKLSYEFALTRKTLIECFSKSRPKLEAMMFSNLIKDPPKDWDWMTEEEQAMQIAKSKAARGIRAPRKSPQDRDPMWIP